MTLFRSFLWVGCLGAGMLVAQTMMCNGSWGQDAEGADPATTQETEAAPKKPPRPPIYNETADAQEQIQAALVRAQRNNKRVLVQWGANWCGWCHLLHDTFRQNREIAQILNYEYEVVLVDVGQFDRHTEVAEKYQADLKKHGLPFLTVLAADGSVVTNQETSSLESREAGTQAHDAEAVSKFLKTHIATPLVAQEVLEAAVKRASEEKKIVFLHFGAPWCGWCHRLEAWLAQPEVQQRLEPVFVDLKIDTDRMTGGQDLLKHYCPEPGGIPWFAWLDPATGAALATSNAEKSGNVGFPASDPEIAHFVAMLKSVERFSADDIEFLKKSLEQARPKPKS